MLTVVCAMPSCMKVNAKAAIKIDLKFANRSKNCEGMEVTLFMVRKCEKKRIQCRFQQS